MGYDRYSPSYLVYHTDTKRIQRCRCVKFTDKFTRNVSFSEVKDVVTINTVDAPKVDDVVTENLAPGSIGNTLSTLESNLKAPV